MPKLNKSQNLSEKLGKGGKKLKKKPALTLRERLGEKRKAEEKRQKIIGLLITSLTLSGLVGLPLILLFDVEIGVAVAAGIASIIFACQYPRLALWAFLIYMPFSGTVTYALGGGNAIFQISKDFLYIPALLALVVECRRTRKPILIPQKLLPSFAILLFMSLLTLLFVNTLQEFLPYCSEVRKEMCKEGIPFLQGVLGLKVLIGYVPLIFCAYYLIEDKKQMFFLGRLLLVLAIICCVLGLMQYWLLSSGRCVGTRELTGAELFKPNLSARCLVGGALLYSPSQGVIRLPGTFVSPWHWGWFLIANSVITFTIAFFDKSFYWRLAGLGGMALVFINAVISGQRIAFALVPVLTVILLILTGQIKNFKRFIPLGVGLVLLLSLAAIFNPNIVQERVASFVGRWHASPPHVFMLQQFDYAVNNTQGILGRGLGKATNSTRVFGPISFIETFHAKLIYEMGYLGTLAFMVFVTHLCILTYQDYRSIGDPSLRSFASSFWVFILIISYFPYWYPLDTDPVAIYYWLFAGVIFKLPVIDKQEEQEPGTEVESLGNKKLKLKRLRKKL
ncbi:MAG: hormogonium polysaccharide biosynthesis protein HpsL [Gomphosphaeria aponina SAG 52.96 = DSM 107014]|uniref:Hormogonium polysaccharide biosynthesis protein HpsL n=1 Tax=Gomphosphaeria aponina SAG 52.96 = DSM 107014 TaxID=1521640 RepID=A0A941JNN2_9CHRO|nr:hormogonium polysaccharide biosynthesis protein HpsL [Gomphosphaeria aponina SAG 52.96 = DSM 107014]